MLQRREKPPAPTENQRPILQPIIYLLYWLSCPGSDDIRLLTLWRMKFVYIIHKKPVPVSERSIAVHCKGSYAV
jgi:hypothetical protein